MCACSRLLHQRVSTFSTPTASRHHVQRTGQLASLHHYCTQPVRGLPALRLRKQLVSSRTRQHGPANAAAEAAAVSQGPGGPNPSATPSSSSSSPQPSAPTAASGAGSTPQPASSGQPAAASAAGSSSSNPSPVPGSTAAGGNTSPGPPGAAAAQEAPFSLKPVYVLIFTLLFLGGLLFASMSLQLTSDMGFQDALTKVVRRIFRSIAFRQLVVITACILLVRFALNNVLRFLARWSSSPVQWDKSKLYYVMKEVYSPLELLLFIAGCCTIADSFVPQLVNVPKATVNSVVRAVLSMSFVVGASVVVFNLKSRFCKEQAWNCEMQGDVTSQRRWEAYDKLGTFAIYVIGTILVIQALGLEVRSVLAIGGIGGLAIGLAGREICENLLNGFLLMTTMPFEVGEEVMFRPKANEMIEGIVVDVGWYRTLIRSFEREMYVIPNAVFSKNTVLNVTRKSREWRFYEYLCVRVQDVHKVNAIIQDIRRIVRNDARIMNKLHRRVFLDKIGLEDVKVYISFYVEASNRDAFMAVKQDLLLAFVDCVERNGAKLAQPRTVLELDPSMDAEALLPRMSAVGLLPPPGVGGYGGRGPNIPITVQVVDSVEVTPIDPLPNNGNGSSGSGGGSGGGSSSSGTKGSSGKAGASSSGVTGKAAGAAGEQQAGQQVQQAPQQQSQQPLQPSVAYAGAGAAAAAAASPGAAGSGRVMDAAGMAAGSNAQRKGAGEGEEEGGGSSSSSKTPPSTGGSKEGTGLKAAAAGNGAPSGTAAKQQAAPAPGSQPQQPAAASAKAPPGDRSSSPSTAPPGNAGSSSSSSSSRPPSSSGSGSRPPSSSGSASSTPPTSRPNSPYTVVTGSGTGQAGGPGAAQQRPDSVTILASFEDI